MKKQSLHSYSSAGIINRIIPSLLLVLSWGTSFSQQDIAINLKTTIPVIEKIYSTDTGLTDNYLVTGVDKKIKADFKDLSIGLSPNPNAGMLSLEIKSTKNRTVLIELRNKLEDELLFRSVDLKEGDNTIPFETDGVSVTYFQLKLSEVNSNSSASFLLLKK